MRLNKYLSENTLLSRRKADVAITDKRVTVNSEQPTMGQQVTNEDIVTLDGRKVTVKNAQIMTLLVNKPVGYVCSKNGQGARTIYSLFPKDFQHLNIAGRLDKDSSGLVVLTNDGELLNELTHPSNKKEKVYEAYLNKDLSDKELETIQKGVDIDDARPSTFRSIKKIDGPFVYEIVLEEGRNRQIRRTFEKLGLVVKNLRRTKLGQYSLKDIGETRFKVIE